MAETRNPHGSLAIACANCHTTTSWKPIRAVPEFNHNTETKYPLRGLHQNVACSSCHISKVFTNVGHKCADCHADLHRRQFGENCESCHTVNGWKTAVKEMQAHTNRFPLFGAHSAVACDSCHRGAATGVFRGLSTECVACHQADYLNTRPLDHKAAGLSTRCQDCHGLDTFKGAKFDHNLVTRFPLTGRHAAVACASCHVNGRFAGTPTECVGCHLKDFTATKDPDHVKAGFPQRCEVCHNTASWKGAVFDHTAQTKFPLTGKHATTDCAQCHVGGKFAGTPTTCAGCHLADFDKTTNPNHRLGNFSTQCEVCHTTTGWAGAKFDHNLSRFPLTGKHTDVQCASCHVGGKYTGTPTACAGCHLQDYQKAASPNHVASGFPQECAQCHTTAAWKPATFNHDSTKFPLTGKHTSVECSSCHVGGKFAGTPTACVGCHLPDFQKTTNPNHVSGGFPQDCAQCHTTTAWQPANFDHQKTRFPLDGKHTTVQCSACHVGGKYTGTPTACVGCHLPDYQKTTDPNHVASGFPQECTQCHTTASWKPANFDHNKTRFPLTGKHTTVQCAQCHVGGKYTGTPTACVGCHLPDYQKTTNPNHVASGFPQDCTQCHTTAAWKPANFDHNRTRFALTGKHASVECSACHVGGKYTGTPTACVGCHLPDYQKTTNPNHVAGGFPQDCAQCHTTTAWQPANFDHNKTKFPLTGKHTTVLCASCHVGGKYAGTPTACVGCHLPEYQKTANPNHVASGFPQDCTQCHTTAAWKPANFDHNKTKFPLTGKHTTVECAQCHVGGKYTGTPTACVGCHLPEYQKTTNPNHVTAGFPQDCTLCHTTAAWKPANFDHNKTKFPLTGKHTTVECAQCHVGGKYAGTPTACVGCHLPEYQKTTSPNHVAAGFSQECTQCHTTTAWKPSTFDHNKTKFPLTGKHTTVECAACHVGGKYAGTPTACVGCHLPDYQKTTNPNHVAGGFPQDCTQCHTTTAWKPANFDHNKTKFPLTGKHTTVECAACHVGGKYTGTPTACVGCHLPDYQKTTNPNHVASGFPQDCTQCHTTAAWRPANFDHNKTKFPLTGKHTTVVCSACHIGGKYTGTPTACVGCHLPDYQKTTNPNHVTGGFPQDCAQCHTTAAWQPANFDHSKTKFPLTGKHTTVTCSACHVGGKYAGTPTACVGCHLPDYQKTTNPNHVASGFPQDCAQCHTTAAWQPANFDHNKTRFPLTGKHTTVVCSACHVGGKFAGTPTDCAGCHLADYQKTTNPSHTAAGFSQTCTACHTTAGWSPSSFNHNTATKFALTGKHTTVACASCHVGNKFAGTPNTCVGCHLPDYQKTTNPNHVTGGFPQDCTQCHTTSAWQPSTFNHNNTKFPLTGKHTTVQCLACHVGGKYAGTPTTCVGCHLPDYQKTTNPNHVTGGFPQDCSICHGTAAWRPATFDHNATKFPLTGKHTTVACSACHVGGKYTGTPTACVGCHLTNYQQTKSPNHAAAGFPQDCSICHSTTAWQPATFDHSKTAFPLAGKHTTTACASCHVNNVFKGTPTDCYSCHAKEYNTVTNPNHLAAGFPKTCQNCHTTTTWSGATFTHKFPIYSGAHQGKWSTCNDCHTNPSNYQVFSCTTCHAHDQPTMDNKHRGVRNYVWASPNCYSCHPNGRAG